VFGSRSALAVLVPLMLVAACNSAGDGATSSAPVSTATSTASVMASATASVAASASAAAPAPPKPSPRLALSEEGFPVVDLHVDTPWRVHFKGRDKALKKGHATPGLLAKGGFAGLVYPIYIPDYIHDNDPGIEDAEAIFDTIDAIVAAHETLQPAIGPGSLKERRGLPLAPGQMGVFFSIEGAGAFAKDIDAIDRFVARGVRLVGPVHAHDSPLASSATGKKGGFGLTDAGKKFCDRVYQAGALVDVSHMSDLAFEDLVPIAAKYDAPIVATHSNARKLRGHKRNLSDEQLAKIGQTGGVAGLNLHRSFVRRGKAKMKHVVEMVQHMVEVAGVDHVAIGTDFDGGNPVPPIKDASRLPALAEALMADGMTAPDVRKIFGENAIRVLYWKVR
jgi:membrane dipeptidase